MNLQCQGVRLMGLNTSHFWFKPNGADINITILSHLVAEIPYNPENNPPKKYATPKISPPKSLHENNPENKPPPKISPGLIFEFPHFYFYIIKYKKS